MPEDQKSEKGDFLTKDEMMSFLKSKGVIIDPKTRNFLRFAKNNGIIYKIVERVGSAGHAPAVYKKPDQKKIEKILNKLKNTNNSLVGRKIVEQKKKLILSIFDKTEAKDDRPNEEKVYRTTIADEVAKKLEVDTNRKFVRRTLEKARKPEINKKLNKPR